MDPQSDQTTMVIAPAPTAAGESPPENHVSSPRRRGCGCAAAICILLLALSAIDLWPWAHSRLAIERVRTMTGRPWTEAEKLPVSCVWWAENESESELTLLNKVIVSPHLKGYMVPFLQRMMWRFVPQGPVQSRFEKFLNPQLMIQLNVKRDMASIEDLANNPDWITFE